MSEDSGGQSTCRSDVVGGSVTLRSLGSASLVKQYSSRWAIEPSFTDDKDLCFGMGMAELRVAEPDRRDRLLLMSAFAMALLTMLGTARESLGMDRYLKFNTSKTRCRNPLKRSCLKSCENQRVGMEA